MNYSLLGCKLEPGDLVEGQRKTGYAGKKAIVIKPEVPCDKGVVRIWWLDGGIYQYISVGFLRKIELDME